MLLKCSGNYRIFSNGFGLSPKPAPLKKSNPSKKGQIYSQVFIYVVAVILFVFVLIYGYNAIRGFRERSEQIAYIKFKTDLASTVKRISPDYGTLKKEDFFIGGDYRKVCFVQSHETPSNLADIIHSREDYIVEDSVRSNVGKNVFLFTDTLQESFDAGPINTTGNGYLCLKVENGKIKVQFLGKGDHTLISVWG